MISRNDVGRLWAKAKVVRRGFDALIFDLDAVCADPSPAERQNGLLGEVHALVSSASDDIDRALSALRDMDG